MSVQEERLKAIADAIRQKEGSSDSIPANDFPARILALETGGLPDGTCTITLKSDPPEGGAVAGGGVASEGMIITVNAAPNEAGNYDFDSWKEGDAVVSQLPEFTFPVSGNRDLLAVFQYCIYVAGVDWWRATLPASAAWYGTAYGNGKFVAVAYGSDTAAYSEDGITWKSTTLPASANWRRVTYGNGKFVAVAGNGNEAAYSEDGITWRAATLPSSAYWYDVVWGDGKFVTVASSNSDKVAYRH